MPRFAEEKRASDAKAWHNISVSTDAEDVKGRIAGFEVLKLVLAWLWRSVARQHSSYIDVTIDVTNSLMAGNY